jgi:AAA+ superfamily predicted ATPase
MQAHIAFARFLLEICCREIHGEGKMDGCHERFEQLAAAMDEEGDPKLFEHLDLSMGGCRILTVLAAAALDLDARRMMKALSGGEGATMAVLRHVAFRHAGGERELVDELGADAPLRRLGLIEAIDGNAPEGTQSWSIAPAVLRRWTGGPSLDPDVGDFARIPASPPSLVSLTHGAVASSQAVAAARGANLVIISGAAGAGRRSLALAAASEAEVDVIEIDARKLSRDRARLILELRRLARECVLLRRSPLICHVEALQHDQDTTRLDVVGSQLVAVVRGPVLVTCGRNRPALRWGRPAIVIEVTAPTTEQRAQLWLRELGDGTEDDGEHLATQYPLAPALIHHAANAAKAHASGRPIQPEDVYAGLRAVLDDRLGDHAKRVEVTQTWDDLVIPEDELAAIQYLIARVRQRRTVFEQWGFAAKVGKGLGTSALLSGPPGTGKTMVAALIAKELGLELYQVDMAKIVSKFVGETERNLAALFDAAEAGHAVLLFDEADSLFGKRTEVKSSNDRYANLETNYLLQRMESFTGICLLTSNHESSIDPAFQRRLSLHVRFQLPAEDERATLWRTLIPPAAPVAGSIDASDLARRFAMSGGYIRNAVLRAAFLAADEGSAITAAHLERAARLEYEGMGKLAFN